MNSLNNYDNLVHHAGMIWVSKSIENNKRGNICALVHGNFNVLAYASPERLNDKAIDVFIKEVLTAQGLQYMLDSPETVNTCCMCNKETDRLFERANGDEFCKECHERYCQHLNTKTIEVAQGFDSIIVCLDCGSET